MEGRRRLLLLLLLAAVGGGAGEEAEEREELYHQLGEPAVVTVVTATTGKPELARCIESVRAQQYHGVCGGRIAPSSLPFISSYRTEKSSWRTGAIQHLVVVDGERFAAAARAVYLPPEKLRFVPAEQKRVFHDDKRVVQCVPVACQQKHACGRNA